MSIHIAKFILLSLPRGGRTRSRGNIFADSAVKFPYIWPLIVFGLSFRNWLRFDSV